MHATGTGENVRAACKQAFTELEAQVKKHQSRLRHDHEWKRKQRPATASALPKRNDHATGLDVKKRAVENEEKEKAVRLFRLPWLNIC